MTDATSSGAYRPEPPSAFRRRLAVIMAADVAGYSRLLATGEEEALALFARCRRAFDAEVARYGGRIFNTAGDSVMSEFDSAVEAVRAAVAIQHAIAALNADVPENRQVRFRIGVNVGDVVENGDDLLGDGVNIASRLEGVARPGGICVSRGVRETAAGKVSVAFAPLGARRLKNIPEPVETFAIVLDEQDGKDASDARASDADPAVDDERAARRDWRDRRRYARRRTPPVPPAGRRRPRRLVRILLIILAISIAIPTIRFARQQLETQLGLRSTAPAAVTPPKEVDAQAASGGASAVPSTGSADTKENAQDAARALFLLGVEEEKAGRVPAARTAFADAARRAAGFVDPPLRMAGLIRSREGQSAARAALSDLSAAAGRDASIRMALAQLTPWSEQVSRLRRLLADAPSFYPGWYAYGMALGAPDAGKPSLARLEAEKAALDRFLAGISSGAAQRFFIEGETAQTWAANARRRSVELAAALRARDARPALSFLTSPTHLTVNITLPEPAASVQYRLGDKGGYSRADLALDNRGDPTGAASFTVPARLGKTTLSILYTDANGIVAGPFAYPVDASELASERDRKILLATSGSWVTWATDRDELFYPYLVNYRCAIRSAAVGFDGAPPNVQLPLPQAGCDQGAPPEPGVQNSIPAPHDARSVEVRLTFSNGEQSPPVILTRDQ